MSTGYTPTTEEVREEYSITVIDGTVLPSRARAFDRWLAAHEAEITARALEDVQDEEIRYLHEEYDAELRECFRCDNLFNETARLYSSHCDECFEDMGRDEGRD